MTDTVVNLRCSICSVKPAKGGEAQSGRLPTECEFCCLWQVMDLLECLFLLKNNNKKTPKSQNFLPKPCDPKGNTSCFSPCCTDHKFPGPLFSIFLHDFFIIYADLIMESEMISRKLVVCRCVPYGNYVPDPEGLGAATIN